MRRLVLLLVLVTTSLRTLSAAQAVPADLSAAKALLLTADYEGALRLLATTDPGDDAVKVEEYRALCLLALGRTSDAERSIEQIFARQPLYAPDPVELSPRMVSLVAGVRQRLLPVLARSLYGLAQRNFEHREYAAAIAQLTEMLGLVDAAGPNAGLDDLRTVGAGFLSLAKTRLAFAAAQPAGPSSGVDQTITTEFPTIVYADFQRLAEEQTTAARAPQPVSAPADPASPLLVRPDIYSDSDRIQPPVAVQREVPPWRPPDVAARQATHQGWVEIIVDEQGAVEQASIVDSVHAAYDAALLEAVRKWRYRPATRNGQPVRYRLQTPVVLRPPTP
jgi:TonB family protein